MTHTEGTGVLIIPIILFNLINIGVSFGFNMIAYILLPKINEKARKNIIPLVIIALSILVFVTELIILC